MERKSMDMLDALMYAAVMSRLSKAYYKTLENNPVNSLAKTIQEKQQDPEFAFYLFDDSFNRDLLLLRIEVALENNDKETFMALTKELKRYEV